MPRRPVTRFAAALALLLAAACSSDRADRPAAKPSGPSLIVEGDRLCAELFRRNAEYLAGDNLTVEAYVAVGDRIMPSFKKLAPPVGDERWTKGLATRWAAVRKAGGRDGDLASAVWQFIGPARASGLWICGEPQDRAVRQAVASARFRSTIAPQEYAKRLDAVIGTYAPAHEEYHHEPDPTEVQKRLVPGDAESHGPGYVAIQKKMVDAMAALPAPKGQEKEAAIFLMFMRAALKAEADGIAARGARGEALFEPSYGLTWQAVGIACVAWAMDLCD